MERVTRVKIVLQNPYESFEDYEKRLNSILEGIPDGPGRSLMSSADHSGRMCCVVHFENKVRDTELKAIKVSELKPNDFIANIGVVQRIEALDDALIKVYVHPAGGIMNYHFRFHQPCDVTMYTTGIVLIHTRKDETYSIV